MTRKELLDKALKCVLSDRNSNYGTPEDNFSVIAKFWTIYKGVEFHPYDVAIMMILLKIARIKHSPEHEDSWIDMAGYTACGGEVSNVKSKNT